MAVFVTVRLTCVKVFSGMMSRRPAGVHVLFGIRGMGQGGVDVLYEYGAIVNRRDTGVNVLISCVSMQLADVNLLSGIVSGRATGVNLLFFIASWWVMGVNVLFGIVSRRVTGVSVLLGIMRRRATGVNMLFGIVSWWVRA